jgi:mono/diheme cytochrome c family protein
MPTNVEVVSRTEYASRLQLLTGQDQPGAAQLSLGRQTWDRVCAKCHGLGGEGDIGPPVAQSTKLVDPQALNDILQNGQDLPANTGYMPPVGRGWPEFQVQALIAYIKSNPALAPPTQEAGG